jgi:hypothetical protein
LAQGGASVDGTDHQAGHGWQPEVYRATVGPVQVAVNPNERFTRGDFSRRGESAGREAAVEVPGDEKSLAWGIVVWKAAASQAHIELVRARRKISLVSY